MNQRQPHSINWPAVQEACTAGFYHKAYSACPPCQGKGDVAWAAAAEYIEAEKARALAALTAAWRASKGRTLP